MMKKLLLALVKFYRVAISPYRPPCCRYIPTCSQYALEAIEKYGALKAAGWRSGGSCAAIRFTREDTTRCPDPKEGQALFRRGHSAGAAGGRPWGRRG